MRLPLVDEPVVLPFGGLLSPRAEIPIIDEQGRIVAVITDDNTGPFGGNPFALVSDGGVPEWVAVQSHPAPVGWFPIAPEESAPPARVAGVRGRAGSRRGPAASAVGAGIGPLLGVSILASVAPRRIRRAG